MALTDIPGLTYTRTGAATAWRADGTLAEFAPNVPRITDLGVLIEGQRTSLAPRWDPNTAQVSLKVGCSDVGAPTIAPLSSRNWLALDNSTTAAYAYQSITVPASTQFTAQCLVETPDGSRPVCDDGSSAATDFNLYAGGAGLQGGVASYRRLVGNVWVISVTGLTLPAPNANFGPVRQATHSKRSLKFSGFQLEQASSASSPIITTGAAATRGADGLRLTGGVAAILAAPYSVVVEAEIPSLINYNTLLTLSSGTTHQYILLQAQSAQRATLSIADTAKGFSQVAWRPVTATPTRKMALASDGATIRWSVDGALGEPMAYPNGGFSTPLTTVHPFTHAYNGQQLMSYGRRLVILPYALTDAELMEMTQ